VGFYPLHKYREPAPTTRPPALQKATPFVFIFMQTPFAATHLFSYSYKMPGGCTTLPLTLLFLGNSKLPHRAAQHSPRPKRTRTLSLATPAAGQTPVILSEMAVCLSSRPVPSLERKSPAYAGLVKRRCGRVGRAFAVSRFVPSGNRRIPRPPFPAPFPIRLCRRTVLLLQPALPPLASPRPNEQPAQPVFAAQKPLSLLAWQLATLGLVS
jgi:hypothetical protein